ncbi:hypothetical protein AOQ84DRAFT_111156 [Glonium stellatum]|uniref:Uncharacterized protein n=1 Tax=Glonium stellatum TaxID=574774 RepID=A0A8E2FAP0_9PEZI|nr:hypothetical protein AOQ84DRAFT_111156 [Glonium stellatum]
MAPISVFTPYVTPTATSLPSLFTVFNYSSLPATLATSSPLDPTASLLTLVTITSVLADDIPNLSLGVINPAASRNNDTSQPSAPLNGSKWWNAQWLPVAAWALLIYDAASLFLLLWLWSVGLMDATLNVSPIHPSHTPIVPQSRSATYRVSSSQ